MANTFRLFTFFLLVSFIYMGDILGNTQHKPFKLKAVGWLYREYIFKNIN